MKSHRRLQLDWHNGTGAEDPESSPGGKTGVPNGGVTAEMQATIQRMVLGQVRDAVKDLVPGVIKATLEQYQAALKAAEPPPAAPAAPAVDDGKNPTLKTLQEQVVALTRGLTEERQKRTEAQQAEQRTRRASLVRDEFVRHLGPNSPHLAPYLNAHLGGFDVDASGEVVRKVKDEFGIERCIPVAEAVDELFKSELKHLAQAPRPTLPVSGLGRINGAQQTMDTRQQMQTARVNPIEAEMIEAIAKERPELAADLSRQAIANAQAQAATVK